MKPIQFPLLALLLFPAVAAAEEPGVVENVVVYKEPGRFAGWPANRGIWCWGDEIVVKFVLGYHDDHKQGGHPIDRQRPSITMQARSVDGGHSWTHELPSYYDKDHNERPVVDSPGGFDFTDPNFALMFRMDGKDEGGVRFFVSYDRCKNWQGPFRFPRFGRKGILARTDYIVNGKQDMFVFLTSEKDGGGEGWPFCARTTDGGKTWEFIGWIGEQPGDGGYAIMPSTVRLKNGAFLSMIRRRGRFDGQKKWWVESFLSPDEGKSWYKLDKPYMPNHGNPAHMIRLRDGRIALTYGWRDIPYGIRAQLTSNEGMTWTDERILRQDGNVWDLGYPRTVQRSDGKCVTAYYFNDKSGKERYIAATIWDPGPAAEQTASISSSTSSK